MSELVNQIRKELAMQEQEKRREAVLSQNLQTAISTLSWMVEDRLKLELLRAGELVFGENYDSGFHVFNITYPTIKVEVRRRDYGIELTIIERARPLAPLHTCVVRIECSLEENLLLKAIYNGRPVADPQTGVAALILRIALRDTDAIFS